MANKLAENPLRIHIYEQILVTGHLDAHPHAHSDHVFLTDNIFSSKQRLNWNFWHMALCIKAHFNHLTEFSQNSKPFGRKSWFSETNFSINYGCPFSEFLGSCYSSKEPLLLARGGQPDLHCNHHINTSLVLKRRKNLCKTFL